MALRYIRVVVFLAFLLSTTVALAESRPGNSQADTQSQNSNTSPNTSAGIQELNFTLEQKRAILALNQKYGEQSRKLIKEVVQAQKEFNNLVVSPSAPESEVREKFHQVESLKRQLDELRFENTISLRSLMTPEQRRFL